MTAILYAKRPFCNIFDEVYRGHNFTDIDEAIVFARQSHIVRSHTTYKVVMVKTGESKIFTKYEEE
jgi:hypothetical protein